MKSFKQFIKNSDGQKENTGYFPVVVHGSHANPKKNKKENTGYFPVVVHGSHASKKNIKEEAEHPNDDHYTILQKRSMSEDDNADLVDHYHNSLARHPDINYVKGYARNSKSINDSLINGGNNLYQNMKAEKIDNVLNDAPPLHKGIRVFSGLGFDPRRHMDENNHLESSAFLSTSTDGTVATGFARRLEANGDPYNYDPNNHDRETHHHILQIDLPKGSQHGAHIQSMSEIPDEREFVLKRKTKLKIHPVPEIRREGNRVEHIWKATPVSSGDTQ
jgi:hypothetical protein